MKISENKKILFFLFVLMFAFFGVAIFILNLKTPFQWDDFRLTQIWPNEDALKVKSFNDILISQYNHYYTWGGRTLVHIIAQYLVFINPLKADILNTMVYLGYVTLIYYHIKGKTKHDLIVFAGVNFLVYFLQPVFGETILWLTGSANYLWGTSLILLFLLPYRMYDGQVKPKFTVFKSLFFLPLGVIAGWTNENTAAALILMVVLYLAYYYFKKLRLPVWGLVGLIGVLIGYFVMILAPGNFMRADLRTGGMTVDLFYLSYRFLTSTQLLFQYLGVFNLLGFILLLLLKRYSKEDKNYSYNLFLTSLYFLGALASVYVMLFSPFFPPRAWFGGITFNIISFGIIFKNLNYSFAFLRQIRIFAGVFGLILFAFTYYDAIRDVVYIDAVWKERNEQIQHQLATGEKSKFYLTNSRTKFALSDPPFLHKCFRWYYGIEVEVQ